MKIGILTLPLHTNYGGILQAYALQTVLERMEHEVVVFDKPYIRKTPLWRRPLAYTKRFVQKYILCKDVIIHKEKHVKHVNMVIRQFTQPFINRYIHRKEVVRFSDINVRDYDAIVVGSDQVWRAAYYRKQDLGAAYLDFAKGRKIKRISYAASFGVDYWDYTERQTKLCGSLLKTFDAVSVREKSGVSLCKSYFGVEAVWVLDPTMLLSSDDYMKLVERSDTPKSKGNLMVYILDMDREKQLVVDAVSAKFGLVPFLSNSRAEDISAPLSERVQPPVESWIRGFEDAEFVITDSFHACVFSILFGKQFAVIGNKNRGMARFKSLLGAFGLEDRLVSDVSDIGGLNKIDYRSVNSVLDELRQKSRLFLEQSLA